MAESWQLGPVKVTAIVEDDSELSHKLIQKTVVGWTTDMIKKLHPRIAAYVDKHDKLKGAVTAFVVEAGGKRILVGTCIGTRRSSIRPSATSPTTGAIAKAAFSTNSPLPVIRPKASTPSSAPICTSIIPATTHVWLMANGFRPFRKRHICFRKRNMNSGAKLRMCSREATFSRGGKTSSL